MHLTLAEQGAPLRVFFPCKFLDLDPYRIYSYVFLYSCLDILDTTDLQLNINCFTQLC